MEWSASEFPDKSLAHTFHEAKHYVVGMENFYRRGVPIRSMDAVGDKGTDVELVLAYRF